MRPLIAAVLCALLAACSPAEEAPATANAMAEAAPAPAAPVAKTPLLNLTPEGLALVDPDSGSSRALAFGLDRAAVSQAVGIARGAGEGEGTNGECGVGPLDFADFRGGLTLWFQDGKFAGWALGKDGAADLRTAAGLGIGSTRTELEAAYAATVNESTLGQEFTAGGLSGILSSPAPDGRVEALWAGVDCVFR
jgi:hypothetical protein